MNSALCVPIIAVSLLYAVSDVSADEIVVTHRSGRVDVIRLDRPDDPVEQILLRRSSQDTASPPAAPLPAAAPAAPPAASPEKKADSPGFRIKWAPPAASDY